MLKRFWQGLPWDGLGWELGRESTDDPVMMALRTHAARHWRRHRVPAGLRAPFWLADRLGWPLAALARTRSYAGAIGLPAAETLKLFRDCLLTGGDPMEVHVWRGLFGGRHPLPARSASRVLTGLGAPEAHALLADKLATAGRLGSAGIAFPVLHGMLRRGAPLDLDRLADLTPNLFVKPRHGRGGRDAFALTRIDTRKGTGDEEVWRIDGHPVAAAALRDRLEKLTRHDDLLLQEHLTADPALEDLSAGSSPLLQRLPMLRPPVLRIATARLPGEPPFLHAALLTIALPGRNPRDFLNGAIHAPVDPADGRLAAGLSLAAPRDRLERLPDHGAKPDGAQLKGRPVPWFAEAVTLALRAMAALPPVPLVHWDIVTAPTGPVLLEGNSAGNWILASLPGACGLDAGPLAPLLARWM